MYFKHQKDGYPVSFITGISASNHAFIQVITNNGSYYFTYPKADFEYGETIKIGGSLFFKDGVKIHIEENDVLIRGEIRYIDLTPIRYDIMGPFKYLPIQCRHKIASLHHHLDGILNINGEIIDFTGGVGYIEGDSGTSFPKNYTWVQCNDFPEKACITAAVANIPFAGFHFKGCVCIVYIHGVEYRLATYLGVNILDCDKNRIVLKQDKLRLEIDIYEGQDHKLIAPVKGSMIREIHERIVCGAKFKFVNDGKVMFEQYSENASFEYVKN